MKITCLQMDMKLGKPDENFRHASQMIEQAMADAPDVIVLPETWNTGFFPKKDLESHCDREGERTAREIGMLAEKYGVNIVAGSVSNLRSGKVFNTAYIFNRKGSCIAAYDKTHLFTPMGEDRYYTPGDHLCRFCLDGVSCGILICYDLRFPELARSLALQGIELLFVVSQWPDVRIGHMKSLVTARAIENQMFVVCCNSCATVNETVFGGNSRMVAPWGEVICTAGEQEQLLQGTLDIPSIQSIRKSINVFHDRRPELYQL